MPATYPTEFKIKTIRRYEKGESIKTLSQELHIAQSTLYRWFQKYRTIQTPQRKYSPAEFDALLKRVKKAEHMLEIIRATECISAIPLQTRLQKLSTLYEQDTEFSVHEICEALEVSRGTFYNHIFRRVDRSKYQQEQKRLMQVVQQVFDDSNQRFGSEKIRITLAANGIHVSRERIQGIMQELDTINEQIRKMTKKEGIAQMCYNGSATTHKTQEGMPCGDYNTERADTQILF